ncbi:MAG TPA: homoserine dehydrogenase, partial [Enterococcus sp.]|nr:homoserine dehydrogenase [Enterococcus sp.]
MDKTLNVGLLGLGVVGGGVVEVLARQQEKIQRETGVKIQITKCLVRAGEDKTQIAQKYGF